MWCHLFNPRCTVLFIYFLFVYLLEHIWLVKMRRFPFFQPCSFLVFNFVCVFALVGACVRVCVHLQSSGISCGSNATLGVDPLSRLCSAGQVTSAQSTASDQGVSFRGHPAAGGEGGKQSSAMVKNEHASSGCLSDEYVVISGDHYSQERSDGDVRERRKTDQQTGSGSDKRKSASLPTNSEPLPLQVVTESLLAIDAQLADLEEVRPAL